MFQFDASLVLQTGTAVQDTKPHAHPDRMNVWLGEILQRDCPGVDLEIVEHEQYGTIIRFCPFELAMGGMAPGGEQLQQFAECLLAQVDILIATEHHKVTFQRRIEETHKQLRLVELPEWAGLGGVRYVPDGWEELLTDQAKDELNKVNTDLVEHLRATDSAFALGEGPDGLVCVKFGMVTAETDVAELLDLVINVGQQVQENSRQVEGVVEVLS